MRRPVLCGVSSATLLPLLAPILAQLLIAAEGLRQQRPGEDGRSKQPALRIRQHKGTSAGQGGKQSGHHKPPPPRAHHKRPPPAAAHAQETHVELAPGQAHEEEAAPQPSLPELPLKEGVPPLGSVKRPRVYLYEVPDAYHEGLAQHFLPGEPFLLSDFADVAAGQPRVGDANVALAWTNSEIGIQRCLAAEPNRPSQPEDADFFYVPYYPAFCHDAAMSPTMFRGYDEIMMACVMMTQTLAEVSKPGQPPLSELVKSRPELGHRLESLGLSRLPELWDRVHGRDHIFPAWLPGYTTYLYKEWLNSEGGPVRLLGDFSVVEAPQSQVVDSEYMQRFGYGQKRDLLFPWHLLRNPADVVAPPVDAPRPQFIYYTGSSNTLVGSSNDRRTILARMVKSQPDSVFVDMVNRFPPSDVQAQMSRSVFCPAPPGDTQLATRHYDAILAGCIPVVLTEGRVPLPFDNVLDWSKFAVLLPASSIDDGTMVLHLRIKTQDEIKELRKQVYAVRPYFMVSPNCSGPSALDLLLHQLVIQNMTDPLLVARTAPQPAPPPTRSTQGSWWPFRAFKSPLI